MSFLWNIIQSKFIFEQLLNESILGKYLFEKLDHKHKSFVKSLKWMLIKWDSLENSPFYVTSAEYEYTIPCIKNATCILALEQEPMLITTSLGLLLNQTN